MNYQINKPIPNTHWTKNGRAVTNLDIEDVDIYLQAIQESNNSNLWIGLPMHPLTNANKYLALYNNNCRRDLSFFWRIFNKIKYKGENQ